MECTYKGHKIPVGMNQYMVDKFKTRIDDKVQKEAAEAKRFRNSNFLSIANELVTQFKK